MLLYCLKRLGLALLVIIVVSLVGFFTLRLSGDPAVAMAGEARSQADVENTRRQYGFDRPLIIQYFDWPGREVRRHLGPRHYFRLPVHDLDRKSCGSGQSVSNTYPSGGTRPITK